jgi:addiction module HigA family antidote
MRTILPSPVHPGGMLNGDFLKPLGISQARLARETKIPPARINQICLGKRSITADTDLRLCRYLVLSEGWWLRLQAHHDIKVAKRTFGKRIERECAALARYVPDRQVGVAELLR